MEALSKYSMPPELYVASKMSKQLGHSIIKEIYAKDKREKIEGFVWSGRGGRDQISSKMTSTHFSLVPA
jgi:hypothetical protein